MLHEFVPNNSKAMPAYSINAMKTTSKLIDPTIGSVVQQSETTRVWLGLGSCRVDMKDQQGANVVG
jgi:hypothetical protein